MSNISTAAKSVTSLPSNARVVSVGDLTAYILGGDGGLEDEDALKGFLSRIEDSVDLGSQIPILNGSYVIAIVDSQGDFAHLIADPLGTRPVYYTVTDHGPVWAFKLKDIVKHVARPELDQRGLDEVVRYRWLEEDRTLIEGVRQILPGHYVCLSRTEAPLVQRYTRVEFLPANERRVSEKDILEATDTALDKTLADIRKKHSHIAILFSGGVDSSLLLAKARAHNFEKLIPITAVYPGFDNPETERVIQVAKHLGVPIRLVEVTDDYVVETFPKLSWLLERPSSYANNIVRAKIFESIASEVTIALTGEGADGMFGGSEAGSNATKFHNQHKMVAWIPNVLRQAMAAVLSKSAHGNLKALANILSQDALAYLRGKGRMDPPLAAGAIGGSDLMPDLKAYRAKDGRPFYTNYEGNSRSLFAACQNRGMHSQNRNQFYCYRQLAEPYGIEVEHPFVSRRVSAIGLNLPDALKSDEKGTKPVLRKLLLKYLPAEFVYASKLGFVTPYQRWMEGALAPFVNMMLEERTISRGMLDVGVLRAMVKDSSSPFLWTAICVELFLRQFFDGDFPILPM